MTTLQLNEDDANEITQPAPKGRGKAADRVEGVVKVDKLAITFHLLGTSPIILNRMSQKTLQTLLMPSGRKTAAQKQSELKHRPLVEYQDSPYRMPYDADVLIGHLASAFKGAMCTAALDLPGAKKAQIGRLVYVVGDLVGIYGTPKMFMSTVRSADIGRTPDVRTRVIIPKWAAKVEVEFVTPLLREPDVVNLLGAAGITAGVGDWRPEKGKGDYGQFKIVAPDDAEWLRRVAEGGRAPQERAIEHPEPYDIETESLMAWFNIEVKRRGFKVAGADEEDDDAGAQEAAGS